MNLPVRFTDDVADLPTHKFGSSSLTWWGVIAFMLIEGTAFALTFAAYFFIMGHEQGWPPEGREAPNLIAGTLFTIVILLSEIPNTMVKKAALAHDTAAVRRLLIVMSAIGAVLVVIRGFEFNMINVRWNDSAYGSIVWALMLLHTVHILTDWADSIVLTALMFTPHGTAGRRFVDVTEDCVYWRFVWIAWLPIYALIYWVPRLA